MRRMWWAVLTVSLLCAQAAHAAPTVLRDASEGPAWARTQAFPTTRAYVVPASTSLAFFDVNAVIGTTDANYQATEGLFLGGPYVCWAPVSEASLVFNVAFGAEVTRANDVAIRIPAIQPKLTLAWSL